jgi:hypothetical protein
LLFEVGDAHVVAGLLCVELAHVFLDCVQFAHDFGAEVIDVLAAEKCRRKNRRHRYAYSCEVMHIVSLRF